MYSTHHKVPKSNRFVGPACHEACREERENRTCQDRLSTHRPDPVYHTMHHTPLPSGRGWIDHTAAAASPPSLTGLWKMLSPDAESKIYREMKWMMQSSQVNLEQQRFSLAVMEVKCQRLSRYEIRFEPSAISTISLLVCPTLSIVCCKTSNLLPAPVRRRRAWMRPSIWCLSVCPLRHMYHVTHHQ